MGVFDKTVFLSGPMTGIEHYNAPAFAGAHARLKKLGAAKVYDPAIEWLADPGKTGSHEHYMRVCLHELTEGGVINVGAPFDPEYLSVRRYDVLVRLPGWESSEGAALESAVAEAIGIEVVDLDEIGG